MKKVSFCAVCLFDSFSLLHCRIDVEILIALYVCVSVCLCKAFSYQLVPTRGSGFKREKISKDQQAQAVKGTNADLRTVRLFVCLSVSLLAVALLLICLSCVRCCCLLYIYICVCVCVCVYLCCWMCR